jgi:hypothetical protein
MIEKKKKHGQNNGVNALTFILFWVISLGFLQFSSWDIFSNIYSFVAIEFPAILQRMWLVYIFHGLVIGLGVGLAQKVAIQALSPIRLKYWLRINLLVFTAAKFAEYLTIRYVEWRTYGDTGIYYLGIALIAQILLVSGQWWILRKHYQQAWLWLLLLVPTLLSSILGYTPEFLPNPIISQALISALALLWMNRQTISPEKLKNSAEAEVRLSDTLPDDTENQELVALYQTLVE